MRSTRGQIIDQALQRVGNTTATFVAQARIRLNRILQDLYQGADWPFLWTVDQAVTVFPKGLVLFSSATYFQKPEDTESLVIIRTGGQTMHTVVHEVDHRTFAAHGGSEYMVASGDGVVGTATVPRIWTMDYGGTADSHWLPCGHAWPLPREQCAATLRYKSFPLDVSPADPTAYDADIPLFPWDTILVDLLFEWAMSYEVDPRRAEQFQVNAESIARSRGASFPERSYPSQVPLDPLVFSTPWRGN